jgi:putative peptidoglycan lipid II flippase
VTGIGNLLDGTPDGVGAVLQGMLGGVVVALVFAAVAYPLDRHDVRPLALSLAGTIVRRRPGRRPTPPETDREETS